MYTLQSKSEEKLTVPDLIDRLLPERLQRFQRAGGVPVTFGGSTEGAGKTSTLVISRLVGTIGQSLRGLSVPAGTGLGGAVLRQRAPVRVVDYASTTSITHEYDHIVVEEERLTCLVAVPVMIQGAVRGVIYGASREPLSLGDRSVRLAAIVASHLQRDIEATMLRPTAPATVEKFDKALRELATLAGSISDTDMRATLNRIYCQLSENRRPNVSAARKSLAPRERETLDLVALGETNLEIAAELGLSEETVKAYLRSAMAKLGVNSRTAAVRAVGASGRSEPTPYRARGGLG